jgi:hypothetical protein
MLQKGKVCDYLTANQVLLNNALDHHWGSAVVPNAIGVDQQNRPLVADPQTVGFGAKDRGGAVSRRPV